MELPGFLYVCLWEGDDEGWQPPTKWAPFHLSLLIKVKQIQTAACELWWEL